MPASLEDYEVIDTIGTGSYGTCRKIRRKKDGKLLVWKELDYGTMSEVEKQMLVSEVNLLRELRHQHIVQYYDRIIDRTNTTLYIIMEYCSGGDLASTISRNKKEGVSLDEKVVWKICSQIVSALKECHSRRKNGKTVLHRDLKPANVFLDHNRNVKLGDFGLARVLNHDTSFAKTFVGTPYYMSPEQMNYMSYNEKSDIWSLGCLLYELCALRPPFIATNQRDLASKICVGRFSRLPYRYSDELNTFISCLLRVDEHKRPTIENLLQHPIVSSYLTETSVFKFDSQSGSHKQITGNSEDTDLSSQLKSLNIKEAELSAKEEMLKVLDSKLGLKEHDLEIRERSIVAREKLASEKQARLDQLMQEYKEKDSTSSDLLSRPRTAGQPSCLSKEPKSASLKKHVSFIVDKENLPTDHDLRIFKAMSLSRELKPFRAKQGTSWTLA